MINFYILIHYAAVIFTIFFPIMMFTEYDFTMRHMFQFQMCFLSSFLRLLMELYLRTQLLNQVTETHLMIRHPLISCTGARSNVYRATCPIVFGTTSKVQQKLMHLSWISCQWIKLQPFSKVSWDHWCILISASTLSWGEYDRSEWLALQPFRRSIK